MISRPPVYITIKELSAVIGCHRNTARIWARRHGLLASPFIRGRVVVARLKDVFPEVYERILDEQYERAMGVGS